MRTTKHDQVNARQTPEQEMEDVYYDTEFAVIQQISSNTDKNTKLFKRYAMNDNSKYIIQTEIATTLQRFHEKYAETYLDILYDHLRANRVDNEQLNNLIQFVLNEKYDTDSFCIDLFDMVNGSNIRKYVNDTRSTKLMIEFVRCSQGLFHINFLKQYIISMYSKHSFKYEFLRRIEILLLAIL